MIRLPNGIWKDTRQGRFGRLDVEALEVITETHPRGTILEVNDLGVSSGSTSVEFYRVLHSAFMPTFVATDLWRDAFVIRNLKWGWITILDSAGNELQHVIGPFVLPGQGTELAIYPIDQVLRWLARRIELPRARAELERSEGTRCGSLLQLGMTSSR